MLVSTSQMSMQDTESFEVLIGNNSYIFFEVAGELNVRCDSGPLLVRGAGFNRLEFFDYEERCRELESQMEVEREIWQSNR